MVKKQDGCVTPAAGPIGQETAKAEPTLIDPEGGSQSMMAQVGQKAPDFEASAYVDGGFQNIKLSDYKGKWITLCFYPGDFTFV